MANPPEPAPPGYVYIYVRYFRHAKTKRLVFPRNGRVFRLLVKERRGR